MDKRDPRSARLIAEALHDDWAEGRPAEFARRAAAHARSRRRVRQLAATGTALALIAITVTVWRSASSTPATQTPRVIAISSSRGYEIISDAELLAQVRDLPLVAVARPDGRREIQVLPNE